MDPNGVHRRAGAARGIGRRSEATTDPFTRSTLTMDPNGVHRRVGAARGIGRRSKATTDRLTRSTLTMDPGSIVALGPRDTPHSPNPRVMEIASLVSGW